jgi:glycosyltransferase involved in cell wall biosynthesis
MKPKLVLVTTVPETFDLLKDIPLFLTVNYKVILISGTKDVNKILSPGDIGKYFIPMVRGINPFFDIYSIIRMVFLLMIIRPDIIHSFTPKAGLIAMVSSWLVGINIRIHTFTGLIFPVKRGYFRFLLIIVDRLICYLSGIIIAEGVGVKNDLIKYVRPNKNPIIIGNGNIAGVNLDYFTNMANIKIPNSIKLINDSYFIFCYIGRLNKDKGLHELYAAFITLPENAALIIAGEVDSENPIDHNLNINLNSHPRIFVMGKMWDVRPVLLKANILVLPSYREGFPNSVLEASAMALPAIVTDVNGSNEIICDGFNGWIVPPRNIAALSKVMQKAMKLDCEDLNKIGENARANVSKKYNTFEYRSVLLSFYQGLRVE